MSVTPRRSFVAHHFVDLPGIALGRVEDDDRLYRGMKDRFAFVVPAQGWAEFRYRGRSYRSGPGVLRLQHPGEMYSERLREGTGSYDVVLLDLPARDLVFPSPVLASDDPRAVPLLRLHTALLAGADPLDRETAAAEAAEALVGLGLPSGRAPGGERAAVRKARAYLLERLSEQVRLDELADHVRLDKFHLIRAFREELGVPPYEYLTHARIFRARQLLRAGVPASRVARTVGFYDQSQLHRHFRRLTGVTPGQYASGRHGPAVCVHGSMAI
jgi:AraC-like DNA-binding protein